MSDLFWPGDERAGSSMTPASFLAAMVAVEDAWLASLVAAGIAPGAAATDLGGVVTAADVEEVAAGSEAGGNPVIPLLRLLRDRLHSARQGEAATWLHRGLTSQDVVDTAVVLGARDVLERVARELREQVSVLSTLVETHRRTVMAGRTLTQHAVPVTFGLKVAGWLTGVLDAADAVRAARGALPVQAGGAAGTLAAVVELARQQGAADPEATALGLTADLAARLGLADRPPWHTSRGVVTRVGDALVGCTDAWGRVAADVVTLSRPEVAELREGAVAGRGGSSTMPQKQNPVLAVLVRRAALASPALAATLHTASALADDERPDGAWHVEWATLRTLARYALVAASQTTELLAGLEVDGERMRSTAQAAAGALLAERRSITGTDGDGDPTSYLGATDALVDAVLTRARAHPEGPM